MPTYISLLRGINVSGQKRILMTDLKELYEKLGFSDVKTYIQSGNVVFNFDKTSATKLQQLVFDKIQSKYGFEVPNLILNPSEVEKIFNYNKRFIFFKENQDLNNYPKGAMNIELIPRISIAVDDSIYPYGLPFVLKLDKAEYNKFVLAHDTGSAIKGYNRADLFIGSGNDSEKIAGNLKEFLELYTLVPYN